MAPEDREGALHEIAVDGYNGVVTFNEGTALILVYVIYLVALFNEINGESGAEQVGDMPLWRSLVNLLIGLLIVIGSAELTVSSAVDVAHRFGISDEVVAIVLIGLGSSLPELSISIAAVMKGYQQMSVGNLIGSNVFDTLVPIGAAALISPLAFNGEMLRLELPYLFFVTATALFFFLRVRGIQRWEAATILTLYSGYVVFKLTGSFIG